MLYLIITMHTHSWLLSTPGAEAKILVAKSTQPVIATNIVQVKSFKSLMFFKCDRHLNDHHFYKINYWWLYVSYVDRTRNLFDLQITFKQLNTYQLCVEIASFLCWHEKVDERIYMYNYKCTCVNCKQRIINRELRKQPFKFFINIT